MYIVLFLMFLAALNFFKGYYFLIFAATAVFLFTPGRKLRLNSTTLVLLIFGVAIILFNPLAQGSLLDMAAPLLYMLCYVIGFGLLQNKDNSPVSLAQKEKGTAAVIYVSAGGTLLHFLLNMIINWGVGDRNDVIDFWSKSIMSATGQAALACLGIGVAIALLFSNGGKLKKWGAVAVLVAVAVYNLTLAGRTIFVFMIVTAAAVLLYVSIIEKSKRLKMVIILTIAVLVLFIMYDQDVFGLKTMVESSNFYERFYSGDVTQEIDETSRWEHKQVYLERFFDHLWGGGNIRAAYGHSAHDLYLDTYDESGILALCAIVIYIISSLIRMVKCIINKAFSKELRLLVLCTYLVCNMEFWVEPIIRGIPWLLALYCFVDGVVTYLLINEENQEVKKCASNIK